MEDRYNIEPADILNYIGISNTKDPDFYDCLLARLVSSYTKRNLRTEEYPLAISLRKFKVNPLLT